jgi:hypothetical protein
VDRIIPTISFLLLSLMVVVLLVFTVYQSWVVYSLWGIVATFALVGALWEILRESRRVPCVQFSEVLSLQSLITAGSVLGGALISYRLSVDVGLGAVTAAALVALVAALVVPDYAVSMYCGSFVGMTSARLLISHWDVAIAGGVAAVLYVLTSCAYPGFGGKLGTIAFTGSVFTGLGLDREFLITEIPEQPVILLIIVCAVVATAITYWLNVVLGHGPVMASGIVGIAAGLILPAVYPEIGGTLAVMAMCASFAGMSSRAHFPRWTMMLGVGLITGLIFVNSMPLLGGAGGKLGTIAFGSVLAVRGYYDLVERSRPVLACEAEELV